MKKRMKFIRLACLAVAFCMAAVLLPAAAFAESENDKYAATVDTAYGSWPMPGNPSPYEMNGINTHQDQNGLKVSADQGYTNDVEVLQLTDGNSVEADLCGVVVVSDGKSAAGESSTVNLKIDGPIESEYEALQVTATNGGTANVTGDNLHSKSQGDGLKIDASGDSTANVTTGKIEARETGAEISVKDSTAEVKVEGNVNAGTKGVAVTADVTADGKSAKADVEVQGSVTSEQGALSVKATGGAEADVSAGSVRTVSEGEGVSVEASGSSTTVHVTTGDISARETGVAIQAEDGADAEVKVEGSVNARTSGVSVIADGLSTEADLTVEGSVTSEYDAVSVTAMNGGTANVSTESVETKSDGGGVSVEASGKSTVNVATGAVTTKETGVTVAADSGATVEVKAGGAVNAGQDGVFILAEGDGTTVVINATQEINAVNEGVDIEASNGAEAGGIVGSVTSSGENAFGVWIRTEESGSGANGASPIPDKLSAITVNPDAEDGSWHTELEGTGDSDASTEVALYTGDVMAYAGVHVEAAGGTAGLETEKVTVTGGNVKDDSKSVEDRFANGFLATDGGVVTGDLESVESEACGIDLYIRSGGAATVNVGKIEAKQIGVHIDNEGGTTWTDVGNIVSDMEGVGITLVGDESVSFAFVDGNLTSTKDNGIEIANNGGHVLVAVAGDAASTADDPNFEKSAGLNFLGSGETKVLVVGTLSGASGVQIEEGSSAKDLDLTVWAIKADDGEIIVGDDADGSFAKSVNYIVMLEQPFAGGTVSASKADGSPLDKKYGDSDGTGFEVANQDQKVLLSVDLEKGYRISGAYNGMENRVALQVDEAGNYFLMVPMGGGVYFTVELSLIPEPSPQPEPKPESEPQSAANASVIADFASYTKEPGEEAITATIVAEDGTPVRSSIKVRFYGDGRFCIVINGGAARVRGNFTTINGVLTLVLADGTQVPVNSDGTFTIYLEDGTVLVLKLEDYLIQQLMKV